MKNILENKLKLYKNKVFKLNKLSIICKYIVKFLIFIKIKNVLKNYMKFIYKIQIKLIFLKLNRVIIWKNILSRYFITL